MNPNIEVPVLLITGYLGSGKTTLVNRILANRRGIKFAVIVNDLGEVNIDADLIERGGIVDQKDDSLVALQNGCICCTLKMDLVEQLHDIANMGRFDYIVIEASGICEPAPIAQTINSIPAFGTAYNDGPLPVLDCIVTVVDALRLKSEFSCGEKLPNRDFDEEDLESLIIQQIEFCNKIILNKAGEVSKSELGRIRGIIKALQPHAEIIETDFCEIDLDKIVGTGCFDFDSVATSAAWISEIEGHHEEHDGHGDQYEDGGHECHDDAGGHHDHSGCHHHDDHCGHHHLHNEEEGEAEEYGISTFVYYRRKPFDINRFDHFVARSWPNSVIRSKGICYFSDDTDKCWLFEQSGVQKNIKDAGLWYATMHYDQIEQLLQKDAQLARDWDAEYGDRMIKLVFIGQKMDKDRIIEQLDSCLQS